MTRENKGRRRKNTTKRSGNKCAVTPLAFRPSRTPACTKRKRVAVTFLAKKHKGIATGAPSPRLHLGPAKHRHSRNASVAPSRQLLKLDHPAPPCQTPAPVRPLKGGSHNNSNNKSSPLTFINLTFLKILKPISHTKLKMRPILKRNPTPTPFQTQPLTNHTNPIK